MMRITHWLVLVVAAFAAVSSCADPAQELCNYWNSHDFRSLDSFDDIDAAQEKFYGYVGLLNEVPEDVATAQMTAFMDSAAKNEVAYMLWAEWFRACLHYMDSPYRNDALFEVFVDKALSDRILDDYELDYFSEIKSLFGKNKPGSFPEELRLADRSGKEYSLSDFRGMETLLVFLDADCPSCLDMLRENASSPGSGDCLRLAVLVNGSPMHIDNISSRLPEEVLSEWTLLWCPDGMKEAARLYDLSYLPFRITLASDGRIVKSYH